MKPSVAGAVARVYLGMIFFAAATEKLAQKVDFAVPMTGFLDHIALVQGYPWYASFVRSVVEPHVQLFALLVIAGEAVAAVGLLFGVATRAAAVLAIVLLANYAAGKGAVPWNPGSNDVADIVLCIVVLAADGGRRFGIDVALHARFPRVPLW